MSVKTKKLSILSLLIATLCSLIMALVAIAPIKAAAEVPAISEYVVATDEATSISCDKDTLTYTVTGTNDAAYFEITAETVQYFIDLGNETMDLYFKNNAAVSSDTWKQVQFNSNKTYSAGTVVAANLIYSGSTQTVTLADYTETGIYFFTDKSTACDLLVTLTLGNRVYEVEEIPAISEYVVATEGKESGTASISCDKDTLTYTITHTEDAAYFEITANTVQYFIDLGNKTMDLYFKNNAAVSSDTWKQVQFNNNKESYSSGTVVAANLIYSGSTQTVTLADYAETGIYFFTDKSTACDLLVTLTLENRMYEVEEIPSISEYVVATDDKASISCDKDTLTYTINHTDAAAYFEITSNTVKYFIDLGNKTMDLYFKNNAAVSSDTWKQVQFNNNKESYSSGTVVAANLIYSGATQTVTLADYAETGIYFFTDKSTACDLLVTLTLENRVYEETVDFDSANLVMIEGASVRMTAPTGLGFITQINKTAYDELVALCGEENVATGTLILPTDYLTVDFTIAALDTAGIQYKNIPNDGWKNEKTAETDGYYAYRGSLAPVQEYNYDRNFSARGYIAYTFDGETTYVYTEYNEADHSRSVSYVALNAYEDVYQTAPEKSEWISAVSGCEVAYTEGSGWKATATAEAAYKFGLSKAVTAYYMDLGATTLKITFGGSFDGTSHTGNPVNCTKWFLPSKADGSGEYWSYNAGFISGLTSNGDGTYTGTIDLTDSTYDFVNYDINIYVNYADVSSNAVGACYVHNVEYVGQTETDAEKYPYAVEKDDYTYFVEDLYSPYTAAERSVLAQYVLFDTAVMAENATATEYQIVKPADATATETTAADLLATYLSEATGITFSVISDSSVSSFSGFSKYISVGQTTLLEAAGLGTYADDNVSGDGYILKTHGASLFIDGILDRGTLYGVLDFAEEYLGYTFIDGECTATGSVASLDIDGIDVAFTPYIETRSYLEYDVCQGYTDPLTAIARKSNNYYVWGTDSYGGANTFGYWGDNPAHTMQATLEKGIELDGGTKDIADYAYEYKTGSLSVGYTTHYQPCLMNETTQSLMANAMKELIKANYANGVRYYALTQEDSTESSGYCTCTSCTLARKSYGGQSGVTLLFLNKIVELLDDDTTFVAAYPDYKLYTFAYAYTLDCPTVESSVIKAGDRVAVMVCPTADNAAYDLFDETKNSTSAAALNGWGAYCEDLLIWMYDANFSNYVEYHPTLTGVMADNVYKLKQLGASYIMVNGAYNSDGLWDDKLRAYVYSELLYNFDETAYNAGADAYVNSLVSEYLTAYYGAYADTVQSVITYFQNAYSGLAIERNTSLAEELTASDLKTQLSNIQAAIDENTDETLEKRLYAVKAGILATLYECDTPLLGATYWSYKDEFTTACTNAGITQWSETQTVTDKFGS